jgi:hypothetical protein
MSSELRQKVSRALRRIIPGSRAVDKKAYGDRPDIAYVHIPKCGGTSLLAAISECYTPAERQSFDIVRHYHQAYAEHAPEDRDAWQKIWMQYRQREFGEYLSGDKKFVYGHMPITADLLSSFQSKYRFFTVFRDPTDRFISNYIYDKIAGGIRIPDVLPPEESNISAELDLYLASREGYWLARDQLIMIAGMDDGEPLDDRALIDRAKQNLNAFELIGFTDQLDVFEKSFSDAFGLDISIGRQNQTSDFFGSEGDIRKAYYAAFDDSVREKVRALCEAEYELYDFARAGA